ncbi:uncharacterized protein V6R79_020641 [Siganus canaliculatus]
MKRSATKPPPPIETWTKEDLHHWLTALVKIHESYADKFCEEVESGENLAAFEKTDILELTIKHGPAVKIACHLESLKSGSQHQSEFPEYVENWTKEQVNQWLLQHVKVYSKYAERLQEEDVSGDCLICFKKEDFVVLGIKPGPAVKILADLRQLKKNPEPTLTPIPPAAPDLNDDQEDALKLTQHEPCLSQTKQPELHNKTTSKTEEVKENESYKVLQPSKEDMDQGNIQEPKPKNLGARRKEPVQITVPDRCNITLEINKSLENLYKDNLKSFIFHLEEHAKTMGRPIPRSKLESRNTMEITRLMIEHFGSKTEAAEVTRECLKDSGQSNIASKLEKAIGQQKKPHLSNDSLRREANQGEKLKNLLTCGGNSLDSYNRFVVVVNKTGSEQVQHLQFLSKLKLFCVLDFDPSSGMPGGVCHSYRELRMANLHSPSQYQGQIDTVIKNLNLYKQTSWVFCNGRHDLDSDSNKELDYKNWLRKCCRDVEHLVSVICNPEVLPHGRSLIIFLLLSPVDTEKDPVFDTYRSFIKHVAEENIISLCESQDTYLKWRELILDKCECDIAHLSICELTLSEINGTIMALGPLRQSSARQLPSSSSGVVLMQRRDEDFMTALDILCLNQCENIFDENSPEFESFKITVEEEFYRGGKVKWWNFYICDKDKNKLFIKRDKYENVKKMIQSQLHRSNDVCVLLTLYHNPGCGATTLVKHVMWDLRKEIRCAVLKDNALPKTEVAIQVIKLMKLECERPTPVLLLVDDSKESENAHDLVNCIHKAAVEESLNIKPDDGANCKVIILNCVRTHSPKEEYRKHSTAQSQFITASLSPKEQQEFEKKLNELKETHEKPENFYSFMIMKSNFDKKYMDDIVSSTLENSDFSSEKGRLFAFLALLNTYVAESEISISLCEDFLGMKMIHWQEDNVMDRMMPYSNFLIIDTVEEWEYYKGIRILHHSIAEACLQELEKRYQLKVSDITTEILHCDLFFRDGVVKDRFMFSVKQMLIERQRKKDGYEREPFSSLIHKIHQDQGRDAVQEIFVKASARFVKSASIPQALARYLYINQRDFPEALKWAENAKKIKENPYTYDTIGQIHKSHLKSNNRRDKKETLRHPEELNEKIETARNAILAFKRAQELANTGIDPEEEVADDESDDYPRNSYNVSGYVGVLEIAFLVLEILGRLPFFEETDREKKAYLQSFLQNRIPITSVYKEDNEINSKYVSIIKEHELFLCHLKNEVKETFENLNSYFTYIKANNSEFDSVNRWTVSAHFKKYVTLFCTTSEEKKKQQQNNPTLNLKIDVEEKRRFLEENQADTFVGILQHLDKPAEKIETITECYAFLQEQQQFSDKKQKTKETINYILSNIILYILKPKSKLVKPPSGLSVLLSETLQDIGLQYLAPDPYYLALLLFWPTGPSPTEENAEIVKYVRAIRKSSHKRLTSMFRNRSTITHLYLGKEKGLKRLISKPQLDKHFKMPRDTLAQLWRNGDIFKEKAIISRLHRVNGTIEQGEVYASYGKLKIPVRPALIAGVRSGYSTEKVSFYLGFAINGPLAYDIQYEN